MELVEGQDLSELIGALETQGALGKGGLSLEDALPIARQIADALGPLTNRALSSRLKPRT